MSGPRRRFITLLATVSALLPGGGATAGDVARAPDLAAGLLPDWRWSHFTVESGLPSDIVVALTEASDDTVWVLTRDGAAWYDGFRWHGVDVPGKAIPYGATLGPDLRGRVLVVVDGRLFRGDRAGFAPIAIEEDGQTLRVTSVAPTGPDEMLVCADGRVFRLGPRGLVAQAAPTPHPVMAVGTTRSGLVWLDTVDGLFERTEHGWASRFAWHTAGVRAEQWGGILAAHIGPHVTGLWAWSGSIDSGLEHLDRGAASHVIAMDTSVDGRAVVVYANGDVRIRRGGAWDRLVLRPPALLNPRFVRFQRNGHLWIGGQEGLYLHRGLSRRWSRLSLNDDRLDVINDLVVAENGDLWAATNGGAVVHRAGGTVEVFAEVAGVELDVATAVAEGADNAIWLGSGSGFTGAVRFRDGVWTHFDGDDGLLAPHVHRFYRARDGRLWFLGLPSDFKTKEPGAFVYDGERFQRWGEAEGLPGRVYAMAEGPDGALWFGTDRGLSRWRDGAWRRWTEREGLRANRLFTVAVDRDGRAWFGHHSAHGGFGYLDEGGDVQYYDGAQGLTNPSVREVRCGEDGTVWLATDGGLFHLVNGVFAGFRRAAGLEHPHLWPIVPRGERIFVGSVGGGVYVLDRSEAAHPAPRIAVERPLIDEDRALFRWRVYPYQGELPADEIETRFRIDEGAWSPWSTGRETAAVARPGDHTIELQAKSLFGRVSDATAPRTFRIPTPFHRHPLLLAALALWATSLLALQWRRKRHQAEALRQREEQFRSLIEEASDLITVLDADGIIEYQSPSAQRLLGYDPADLTGTSVLDLIHEEARAPIEDLLRGAAGTRSARWSQIMRMRHADGSWRIIEAIGRPLPGDGATSTIVNSRDITDRRRAEEAVMAQAKALRILVRELDHRVRNNLASLLTLIDLSQGSADSIGSFADSIRARTRAMATAHGLLSTGRWQSVEMAFLVQALVPPEAAGRLTTDGPELRIGPGQTQALGMVLNELMTNSMKHGALGVAAGRVNVRWETMTRTEQGPVAEIHWEEHGGPPICAEPEPRMGTSLIEGLLVSELSGRVELTYPREGARHTLFVVFDDTPPGAATAEVAGATTPGARQGVAGGESTASATSSASIIQPPPIAL